MGAYRLLFQSSEYLTGMLDTENEYDDIAFR